MLERRSENVGRQTKSAPSLTRAHSLYLKSLNGEKNEKRNQFGNLVVLGGRDGVLCAVRECFHRRPGKKGISVRRMSLTLTRKLSYTLYCGSLFTHDVTLLRIHTTEGGRLM